MSSSDVCNRLEITLYAGGLNGSFFAREGKKKSEHFMFSCGSFQLLNYSTIYIIINCFDRSSSFASGWEIR